MVTHISNGWFEITSTIVIHARLIVHVESLIRAQIIDHGTYRVIRLPNNDTPVTETTEQLLAMIEAAKKDR